MRRLFFCIGLLIILSCLLSRGAGDDVWSHEPVALATSRPAGRLVFGSCNHQDKPQLLWDDIIAETPDVFVFNGAARLGRRDGAPCVGAHRRTPTLAISG